MNDLTPQEYALIESKPRIVRVRKGQVALVKLRKGLEYEIVQFESGAVTIRNAVTGRLVVSRAPKDSDA